MTTVSNVRRRALISVTGVAALLSTFLLAVPGSVAATQQTTGGVLAHVTARQSPARAASSVTATRVHRVRPVDDQFRLVPRYHVRYRRSGGSCWTESFLQPGAWRCMAHSSVYDPCWRVGRTAYAVVCMLRPWRHGVVRIKLKQRPTPQAGGRAALWGLRLANGSKCLLAGDMRETFQGRTVNYLCAHRWVLLGRPDRSSELWTMHTARGTSGHYRATGVRDLPGAWFPLPNAGPV